MIKISTSSQRHGKRNIVSYTLSRSFSLAVIVVFRSELPSYISSIKYFNGDFSNGKLSDTKNRIHKSAKEISMYVHSSEENTERPKRKFAQIWTSFSFHQLSNCSKLTKFQRSPRIHSKFYTIVIKVLEDREIVQNQGVV